VFERNAAKVDAHNADPYKTYEMGINQFTGLTDDEFVSTYLNPVMAQTPVTEADGGFLGEPNADIDWVDRGMISPVKDQGQCGSCWAFSATGQMESFFLFKGVKVSLAEQQLVDCSSAQGNQGCNGGWPHYAMNYVRANGMTTTSAYPYVAKTQSCKIKGGDHKITSVSSASGCVGLENALASRPISIAVDATNWSPYKSGIFSNCKASLNHAVLLVGKTTDYWKIKNSWGAGWGESGYIRTAPGNTCGMCNHEGVWAN
jgi:C1A family cysteine protease